MLPPAVQGVVPEDVKLLPGQLLGIRQTVREAHPPPLPHRPPLPSFESPDGPMPSSESPYAHIDEYDSEPDEESTPVQKQPHEAKADVDSDRLTDYSCPSSNGY